MTDTRFPGAGRVLSAKAPSPPSPSHSQSSSEQLEPTPPTSFPFLNLGVIDNAKDTIYYTDEGGVIESQNGAQIIGGAGPSTLAQTADLSVIDNSSNTQHLTSGYFREHYGPILMQYQDDDDDGSDRRSSTTSSSYDYSDEDAEPRFVEGRRDSPVAGNYSRQRASQRSSFTGSIVDSRFATPPEDIRRPGNPTGAVSSTDSITQMVHTFLAKVNGDSPLPTPPRGRTPDPVNVNGNHAIPIPNLSPTRPLSTVKRLSSPRPMSPPQDSDPVIPPRLPRSSTGQETTTTDSDSSSMRRVSEAQFTSAPSSDRFSPLPHGDGDEKQLVSSPVQEQGPVTGHEDSQSQSSVAALPPSRSEKGKEEDGDKVGKKAGCLSCCIIC